MLRALPHRTHGREGPLRVTAESALWTTAVVVATLLAIAILFFGVLPTRAF